MLRTYHVLIPPIRQRPCKVDMPAIEHGWCNDHVASLWVVLTATGDSANLIYRMGVAGGDQLIVGSNQALSSGEGAELGAGLEAVAEHGVIGLGSVAGLVMLGASR